MTVLIYYFSGTGNTAWAGRQLCEILSVYGHKTRLISIERIKDDTFEIPLCDMIGLLFPVHGGYAPPEMQRFIEGMPPAIQLPFFTITTCGRLSGDAGSFATRNLRRRGYIPFCIATVRMPNNLYFPPLNGIRVSASRRIPQKLDSAAKRIGKLAEYIHQRKIYHDGNGFIDRIVGSHKRQVFDKSAWWIKRSFETDPSCDRCGWCVAHCPSQNIRMDHDGIHFLRHCTLCMRCFSFCHKKAIQITEKTKNRTRYPRYTGTESKPYGISNSPQQSPITHDSLAV